MNDIHARAKQGIKLLMGRQVFLQILTFGGGVVLARALKPAEFGLYAIAGFLVGAFALLGDFGLAPSLIQRKADIGERDLQVGFTLQLLLTTVIVAALFVAAPFLARLYPHAPPETVWLVRALAVSLYLTTWRAMSALQLERQLRYDRLAWIEVAEIFVYQGAAVALALAGSGVWSFVWATMARGVLGTALVYRAAPWRMRLGFDGPTAWQILRFGVPFQLASLANQFGGWVTPLVVGAWIGPQAVGFLSWASSNGKKPLVLLDNAMRVAFPHFSRLQEDRGEVDRLLTRYLNYLVLVAGWWFVVLLAAGPSLVEWIYTDKWKPAVPALTLCAASVSFEAIGWVAGAALMGLGMVKIATQIVLVRSVLCCLLGVVLVRLIGFNGVPLAGLITSAAVLPWMLEALGKGTMQRALGSLVWGLLPVLAGALVGELTVRADFSPPGRALFSTTAVSSAYLAAAWLTAPSWLKNSIAVKLTNARALVAAARAGS